jgi:hypothetical protein
LPPGSVTGGKTIATRSARRRANKINRYIDSTVPCAKKIAHAWGCSIFSLPGAGQGLCEPTAVRRAAPWLENLA